MGGREGGVSFLDEASEESGVVGGDAVAGRLERETGREGGRGGREG